MSPQANKFLDGCHRYGWLINIVVMFMMFAYFTGQMDKSIQDLRDDVTILKSQVFELARITRGPKL